MEERIFDRAFRDLFHRDIRSAEDFERWGDEALANLPASVRGRLDAAVPVLEAVAKVRGELFDLARANPGNRHAAELTGALGEALLRLVPAHFVDLYEADRLPHLVRYAAAVGIRARRAVEDPRRDGIKAAEVEPVEGALQRFLAGLDPRTSPRRREAVEALHWEIEEYKVSVFAQELGTAHPVSRKRILARIRDIERMV
jgi:ATP-dependent helicase HrpA